MQARPLAVEGAYVFTPASFSDHRGGSVQVLESGSFAGTTGRPFFPVAQTLFSTSRRGVVRGIHYTVTPPGSEKYVYCARGASLDLMVDLRVGSPTFGVYDAVQLTAGQPQTVYFPVGVGHAFAVLEDDTVMAYLLSNPYVPEHELALSPTDPELALPLPEGISPIMSERDQRAPTLAAARDQGLLPDYAQCRALERAREETT